MFHLKVAGSTLVEVGDRTCVLTAALADLPQTQVDLSRLGDLVESIVTELRSRYLRGETLPWRFTDVDTFVGRCFFHHQDSIDLRP